MGERELNDEIVKEALKDVIDPELGYNIVDLGSAGLGSARTVFDPYAKGKPYRFSLGAPRVDARGN